jgi:hypothetical protein
MKVFWLCPNVHCKVSVYWTTSNAPDALRCPGCTSPVDPESALLGFDPAQLRRMSPDPDSGSDPYLPGRL